MKTLNLVFAIVMFTLVLFSAGSLGQDLAIDLAWFLLLANGMVFFRNYKVFKELNK